MSEMQYVRGESKIKKDFLEHFEKCLGRIEKGWKISTLSNDIQVVRTKPEHLEGTDIYTTLGLSNTPYRLRNSENLVRCEIFLMLPENFGFLHIPSILEDVVMIMEKSGTVFLRGDVIGPKGELFPQHNFTSLYIAPPFLLPDESHGFTIGEEEVLFIWLVPITTAECQFVEKNGWEAFEDRLEEAEVDVLDMQRASAISL